MRIEDGQFTSQQFGGLEVEFKLETMRDLSVWEGKG